MWRGRLGRNVISRESIGESLITDLFVCCKKSTRLSQITINHYLSNENIEEAQIRTNSMPTTLNKNNNKQFRMNGKMSSNFNRIQ